MPHYFFHTHIADEILTDPDGVELPDADRVWEVARATAGAALKGPEGGQLVGAILVVTDAEGEVVLEFPFAEALTAGSGGEGSVH